MLCCSVLLRAVAVVVAGFLLVIGVSAYAVSVAPVLSYFLVACSDQVVTLRGPLVHVTTLFFFSSLFLLSSLSLSRTRV